MTSFKKVIMAVMVAGAVVSSAYAQISGGTADATPVPGGTIRMNSVGFLPDHNKRASIVASSKTEFTIKDATTNEVVYSKESGTPFRTSDTPDNISVADFSDFETPGEYYLEANGERSPNFKIGADAFNDAFKTMMLGMYLWRCGMEHGVEGEHNGHTFSHPACHRKDGDLSRSSSGMTGTKEATGGWHDAGDYNKYVVNSGVTVGLMLKAWEDHSSALNAINIRAPKDGNIPQYLSEVKWNLDWVAKMQFDNGWVSHKMTAPNFNDYKLPDDENNTTRYFMPRSSAATGAFAAMLAQASRIYRPYDAELADKWLEQSKKAFEVWEESNFEYIAANTSNTLSVTGAYSVSESADRSFRRWAAIELWETTGESKYLEYFEDACVDEPSPWGGVVFTPNMSEHLSWGNVDVIAGITYLTASKKDERNSTIVDKLTTNLISAANGIATNTGHGTGNGHNYGRPFGTDGYYWGNHGASTANVYILNAAAKLSAADAARYRNAGHEILGHIFGRNYFGRSYVTGVGHNPPVNTHCRRSVWYYHTGEESWQWPGYLVGGPHTGNLAERNGDPIAPPNATCVTAGVCYFDDYRDYARNEIAINWNASMLYALSGFVSGGGGHDNVTHRRASTVKKTAPRIQTSRLVVKGGKSNVSIPQGAKVYDLQGRLIAHRKAGDMSVPKLRKSGVYIMRLEVK